MAAQGTHIGKYLRAGCANAMYFNTLVFANVSRGRADAKFTRARDKFAWLNTAIFSYLIVNKLQRYTSLTHKVYVAQVNRAEGSKTESLILQRDALSHNDEINYHLMIRIKSINWQKVSRGAIALIVIIASRKSSLSLIYHVIFAVTSILRKDKNVAVQLGQIIVQHTPDSMFLFCY